MNQTAIVPPFAKFAHTVGFYLTTEKKGKTKWH